MHFRPRVFLVLSALISALMLSACASKINLDDVGVRDAVGTTVSPPVAVTGSNPQGTQTGVMDRNVQAVNVGAGASDAAGPAGVARVILFDHDSFVIKPEFQGAIDAHARFLATNKNRKMAIEGHTDETGGREYNLALGQKRAEAVRRALGLLGVADLQIEAVSFGKEKPADPSSNEQAYAKNRRAELNYK